MNYIFLLICIFTSSIAICQKQSVPIYLKPVFGVNLHTDVLEEIRIGKPPKVLSSALFGIEIGHKHLPLSIRYQRLHYQRLQANIDRYFLGNYDIRNTWENDEIGLFYNLKKVSLGLSHYWKKRENSLNHSFASVFIRKGFNVSISYPVEWFDVVLRSQIQYYPVFAALVGIESYSLSFLYKFDKDRKLKHQLNFMHLNAVVGARFFPLNIQLIGKERLVKPFGIAPQLGLEFLFDKYNMSVNLEKDWWLSFNGGSQNRDIKGLIYNTFVGIKYHQQLKNLRHIRYGFGGSWTEDGDYQFPNSPPKNRNRNGEMFIFSNYQVKGFAASISYEILPNTDIELKTMLPIAGETVFANKTRTSIGIIYRYNPFRPE